MSLQKFEGRIGFVGAGNMGGALIQGFLSAGVEPRTIQVFDPDRSKLEALETLGVEGRGSLERVVEDATVVVLAVKPNLIAQVLEAAPEDAAPLWLSVAAGVTTTALEDALEGRVAPRVVRAMPNTPALVRAGATAIAAGRFAGEADLQIAEALMSAVGSVVRVPESLMDAVTGLSGSGPAYVMLFLEALADAGVRAGLPRRTALTLAIETVRGAATLVAQTGLHPAELKDQVASPGGTTIAGLVALEQAGFRGATMSAVLAATARARELSGR